MHGKPADISAAQIQPRPSKCEVNLPVLSNGVVLRLRLDFLLAIIGAAVWLTMVYVDIQNLKRDMSKVLHHLHLDEEPPHEIQGQ